MKTEHDIRPVTDLKSRAARLLAAVESTRRPVVITQKGRPKAVLVDFESWQEVRRAILLLRLLGQGEADVRARRTVSQERVFAELRTRIPRG